MNNRTQVFAADHPLVLDGSHDVFGFTPKERRRQAKRIQAAAPDLYVALKELFADYKRLADSGDAGNWKLEEQIAGQVALAALAKAEGRTVSDRQGE